MASQEVRKETIRGAEHRGSGQKVKEKWGEVSTLGTQLSGGERELRGLGCDSRVTIKHNPGLVFLSLGPDSDPDFRTLGWFLTCLSLDFLIYKIGLISFVLHGSQRCRGITAF